MAYDLRQRQQLVRRAGVRCSTDKVSVQMSPILDSRRIRALWLPTLAKAETGLQLVVARAVLPSGEEAHQV